MASSNGWKSLIRFKDRSGKVQYGEPDDQMRSATVFEGGDIFTLSKTSDTAEVAEVSLYIQFHDLHTNFVLRVI